MPGVPFQISPKGGRVEREHRRKPRDSTTRAWIAATDARIKGLKPESALAVRAQVSSR
jgi:hypothetical protein